MTGVTAVTGVTAACGLAVAMPDGTRLGVDVYRPAGAGRVPALLIRTPYDRAGHLPEALGWAAHGYAHVTADVRGRYGSQGVWEPFTHELGDGLATLDWLTAQSWSDGRVVVSGWGYEAWCAQELARSTHPAVAALVSCMPSSSSATRAFTDTGVPLLARELWWRLTHGQGRTSNAQLFDAMATLDPAWLQELPVAEAGRRGWTPVQGWPATAPSQAVVPAPPPAVPSLHVTAWYDGSATQTLRSVSVRAAADPPRALVVGPWTSPYHQPLQAECALDFGPEAEVGVAALAAGWLDAVLSGAPAQPRVRVFMVGENRWLEAERWPPDPGPATVLHAGGDGSLGPQPPDTEASRAFVYDPHDPAPSLPHSADHAVREPRTDILGFDTGPLADPLRCLGNPVVELTVATDAPCTDWLARLLHVTPAGQAFRLGEAIAEDTGGTPHRVRLELPPIGFALPPGHGLRLEVTSSAFPEYPRSLGTGEDRLRGIATRPAHQTVCTGPRAGATVLLPDADPAWSAT